MLEHMSMIIRMLISVMTLEYMPISVTVLEHICAVILEHIQMTTRM
jgi:hypothetical protein